MSAFDLARPFGAPYDGYRTTQGVTMDEKDAFFEGQLTAMQWALLAIIEASPSREEICATALRGVAVHDERYRHSDCAPAVRDEFLKGLHTAADLLFAPRHAG